jgi:hypothetical protein
MEKTQSVNQLGHNTTARAKLLHGEGAREGGREGGVVVVMAVLLQPVSWRIDELLQRPLSEGAAQVGIAAAQGCEVQCLSAR